MGFLRPIIAPPSGENAHASGNIRQAPTPALAFLRYIGDPWDFSRDRALAAPVQSKACCVLGERGVVRRLGIQARVFFLVCGTALPLIALSVYRAHEDQRRSLENAKQDALLIARVEATRLGDRLNQMNDVLAGLAAGLAFDRVVAAGDCEIPLKRLKSDNGLAFISLVDLDGNPRCSEPLASRILNVRDRSYFKRAIESKRPSVSELVFSQISGEPLLITAQPVNDRGGVTRFILLASMHANALARSPQETVGMNGAVVSLVDLNGTIIARFPDVREYRGKSLPGIGRSDGAAPEGLLEYTGLDGVARLGAYSRIPGDHWPLQVVVGIPRADIEGPPNEALARELMILAAVLAAALGISFLGSQRLLIGPLNKLTRAAQRYDGGDLSARSGVDHGLAEIGILARSFDQLAEHNRRKTRALKALSAGNRTLLREKKEDELLSAMCRVAVNEAGYRVAFVNYAEQDDARSVRTVARAGQDDGFIDLLKLTWADEERGQGSVGTAIRTGKPNVVRSMASEPRFSPWRDAAAARSLGSVVSFPLWVAGNVIGTFTLIADEEDAFDDDECALLDEMAADLSFGIETIRAEARRKEAEALASRALTHDAMVDLPNRPTFIRMVTAAIADARRGGLSVAILAVHVGRLQEIFDSFGYEPYRAVLKEVAARLATVPVCHDASARLPMEEFGVLVPSKDLNVLGVIADRLLGVFKAPISAGTVQLDVRAAIGASFFPEHGDDGESLIRRASLVARDAFRKDVSFQVYSGASEREKPQQLALAAQLRAAIDGDKLELHYQPKVRVRDSATIGYEALARWFDGSRGAISPATFIPLAEQMGMIGPMSNRVIRMAVRQLHDWLSRGTKLPVAVNLSARNLYDPLTLVSIERWLKSYNVPGELLHFEVTESALVEEPQSARDTLNRLRDMGATIYIDDFGTGYSSLSYLATLPVNSLKIDRSFINQMGTSPRAYSIVSSIISMAHTLRMSVVAEGVETAEQLEALKRLDCDEAQGYLFGKPVPPDEV